MNQEQRAALRKVAEPVKGWGNCDQAWLDTSDDESAAVVGHINEDGETYPVAVIDCDQYYQGQDSLPLAKFYAAANPSTILQLLDYIETLERQRGAISKRLLQMFALSVGQMEADGYKVPGDVYSFCEHAVNRMIDEGETTDEMLGNTMIVLAAMQGETE